MEATALVYEKDDTSYESFLEQSYANSAYKALPFAICTLDYNLNILWANENFYELINIQNSTIFRGIGPHLGMESRRRLKCLFSGEETIQEIVFGSYDQSSPQYSFEVIHRVYDQCATFLISRIETIETRLKRSLPSLKIKYGLSSAELEIAKLMTKGISTADVAHERQVSIATVRSQLRHLREKMGAHSSLEIAVKVFVNCLAAENDINEEKGQTHE